MSAPSYDLIIVGGGVAGTACAHFATRRGLSVLLLERRASVGMKVCSEGSPASPSSVFDLAPFARSKVKAIRLFLDQELLFTSRYSQVAGYVIDRPRLCRWLKTDAAKHGARVETGEFVRAIRDSTVYTQSGREIAGRFVIFADGTSTLARRTFDFRPYRTFTALQHTVQGRNICASDTITLFIFSDEIAFGWTIPAGRGVAYVGVSSEDPKVARRLLDGLMGHRELRSAHVLNLRGAPVPTGGMIPRIIHARRRQLVCGDAAGQYLPLIGEGNRLALASAKFAADAVADGDLSSYPARFAPYRRMIEHHGRVLDLLRDASPTLRRTAVRDFAPSIISAWLHDHGS